jgi:hypothetical protein
MYSFSNTLVTTAKQYGGQVLLLAIIIAGALLLPRAGLFAGAAEQEAAQAEQVETRVSYAAYASDIVARCADSSYKPTCYDDEIPKLMDTLSMEQAFEVTRAVQEMDRSYTYCHVLGHKLSAIETAKDPSKWKDVITRSPHGLCSNGSIHGAFQERFRRESLSDEEIVQLKPELMDVCEPRGGWKPTGLEQGSCYHALGHLTMYITDGTIERATALCGDIALQDGGKRDYRQLCYDGSFMQIFQPLEPDDFALVKGKQPTKEQLPKFCGKFTGLLRGPCWNEGWPLFRDTIMTASGLDAYCSKQFLTAQPDIDRCYNALVYVVTAQMQLRVDKVGAFCNGLAKENYKGRCFANGAGRMVETDYRNVDIAAALCAGAAGAPQEMCYNELVVAIVRCHANVVEKQMRGPYSVTRRVVAAFLVLCQKNRRGIQLHTLQPLGRSRSCLS